MHLPESTALHSDKGLDVLYSTAARFVSRAPSISGHLRAIASRSGEKCGLIELEGAALYRNEIEREIKDEPKLVRAAWRRG